MNKATGHEPKKKNSRLVIFAFATTVFFQITAYKFIWDLDWVSRLLNIATIIIFSGYALKTLMKLKFNKNVFGFYILPGLLVYIGFFINISINSISNLNIINQYGLLIPWAVYLAIPAFVKLEKLDIISLWCYFYYFMLATVSASIIEYCLLIYGFLTPHSIITSGGPFLAGYFSMLYGFETGDIYYRFYASFMEPGTLAMFLLPAMAYAFFYRKYLSLAVFIVALYMTDSLGGLIGAAMLIPLLIYFRFQKRALLPIILSLFSISLMITFFANDLLERYEKKDVSASTREENLSGTVKNLPNLILNYPLGLPLSESTEQAQKNTAYYGSNFTPGNAFNLGGIMSFVGYLAVLFVSLWYAIFSLFRKKLSLDEQTTVVSIFCLMPFIFQRTVVWDSSIFGLLFAPFIISFLHGNRRIYRTTQPIEFQHRECAKN